MAGNAGERRNRGRPPQLRAETEEAAALVEFLRKVTAGVTVREVAERVPRYKRTQWARFLNGSELIPRYLLEQLVEELVREPRLRKVRLEQGLKLLEAAERAAAGRLSAAEMRLPERELRRRLDEAQRGMIEAQRQLLDMTRLVSGLVVLTASLQRRCAELERRRPPAPGTEIVQYQRRLEVAERNLAEARDRRQEAEALRTAALQRAERYRHALEQELGASVAASGAGTEAFGVLEPTPEEYDALLEQSSARLEESGRAFEALRRRLDLDPADQEFPGSDGRPVVRGQVQEKAGGEDAAAVLPAALDPAAPALTAAPDAAVEPEGAGSADDAGGAGPEPMSLAGRIAIGTVVVLFAGSLATGVIGMLAIGIADGFAAERREATPAWVASGAVPSQVPAPRSRQRHFRAKALAYRMSAGQSVSSTFALPRLKKTYSERIFHTGPLYVFDGYIDFQPDRTCASSARVSWRLHKSGGRFPLTHEVDFYELDLPSERFTLTARLDAPSPCTGVLRLIAPQVTNNASHGGKSVPPPEVATERR
ncbi:hypothetical protein GWI34_06360 [Actinomadura sp. DSM 109109]|nr:hypothetical protein [Actinomadura lepetitiana]